jgi:hypothetical protein
MACSSADVVQLFASPSEFWLPGPMNPAPIPKSTREALSNLSIGTRALSSHDSPKAKGDPSGASLQESSAVHKLPFRSAFLCRQSKAILSNVLAGE